MSDYWYERLFIRLERLVKLPLKFKHYLLGHKWEYHLWDSYTKEGFCSCGASQLLRRSEATGNWEIDDAKYVGILNDERYN